MPAKTRHQGARGRSGSSVAPSDSTSQPPKPFNRQDNSTKSSRESLVESDQYDYWYTVKPYLESLDQETTSLDPDDANNATYKPQSCQ